MNLASPNAYVPSSQFHKNSILELFLSSYTFTITTVDLHLMRSIIWHFVLARHWMCKPSATITGTGQCFSNSQILNLHQCFTLSTSAVTSFSATTTASASSGIFNRVSERHFWISTRGDERQEFFLYLCCQNKKKHDKAGPRTPCRRPCFRSKLNQRGLKELPSETLRYLA